VTGGVDVRSSASFTLPPPPDPVWDLAEAPDGAAVAALMAELSLPQPLCELLVRRGFTDSEGARRYLRPRLEYLHPPEALPDLPAAADRVLGAVRSGECIFVHGDYDVDGVCATTILTRFLRSIGGTVVPFVPHRQDGYDLGPAGIAAAQAAGATLLITCDSGIVAHESVAAATALGMDVIVTDHHTPGATLPPALAVINPCRADSAYPERTLCGAGVAFKLVQYLARKAGEPEASVYPLLAYVALATVADLVPLEGENRILVRFGLRYLTHTTDAGLRALLEVTGLEAETEVDAGDVGFQLGPRINAVGRVEAASTALDLLLTEDPSEATRLARQLDDANRVRRSEEIRVTDEAMAQLAAGWVPERDLGVVLVGEGWHPGVIGIVASRLKERLHRPVLLIALKDGVGRGSGRSISSVDLYAALSACAEHMSRFGGHRQAAGFEIDEHRIPALRAAFNAAIHRAVSGEIPPPRLAGEVPLPLAAVDEGFFRMLEAMRPFGMGNPRPLFWTRQEPIVGTPRVVGNGHLKLRLRGVEAIGFGLAHRRPPEALQVETVDVVYQLHLNRYQGRATVQAQLQDVRPANGWTPGPRGA
jgi:single-stranded-DNA-specific exonuclease